MWGFILKFLLSLFLVHFYFKDFKIKTKNFSGTHVGPQKSGESLWWTHDLSQEEVTYVVWSSRSDRHEEVFERIFIEEQYSHNLQSRSSIGVNFDLLCYHYPLIPGVGTHIMLYHPPPEDEGAVGSPIFIPHCSVWVSCSDFRKVIK